MWPFEFQTRRPGDGFMLQALSHWGLVHSFENNLVPGIECSVVNETDTGQLLGGSSCWSDLVLP